MTFDPYHILEKRDQFLTCTICGKQWLTHPGKTGYCPGKGYYGYWNDVPAHLKSLGQWKELGRRPAKGQKAEAWIHLYMYGWMWANLWREDQTAPIQVRSAESKAKTEATSKANRTCAFCQHVQESKIHRLDRLCDDCVRHCESIKTCQRWIADGALIFDTETTGLNPGTDEIIQLALVDMAGNTLIDTFVKPLTPVEEVSGHWEETDWGDARYRPSAFEIHGISNAMLEGAPSFPEVWQKFLALAQGKLLIAYGADFDVPMLRGCKDLHGLPTPGPNPSIQTECAKEMYAYFVGDHHRKRGYRWHKLTQACEWEHVEVEQAAHTALGDCLRTLGVIRAIAAKPVPVGVEVVKPKRKVKAQA